MASEGKTSREDQCWPPAEHLRERWHWIIKDDAVHPVPWGWTNNTWRTASGFRIGPKKAFAEGFRYVGPAIPPKVKS